MMERARQISLFSSFLTITIITQTGLSHASMNSGEPPSYLSSQESDKGRSIEMFSGHHLKACCFEMPRQLNIKRNASGNIISLSGINSDMLSWLSSAYNFTHECLTLPPSSGPSFPNTSTSIGFYHMLQFGMCDVVVGPLNMMYIRFPHFDFLNSYMATPAMMLIPKPKVSVSNLDAIWKPFQPTVWVVLLIVLVVVTLSLAILDYFSIKRRRGGDSPTTLSYLVKNYGLFIFQTVALQGGYLLYNNKLKMRLAMGVWCLLCFVLVGSYTSVLTSFITAPRYQPLISSLSELAKSKEANPIVINGWATDILITGSESPILKEISHKIEADSKNRRCHNATLCYEMVTKGENVYIDGRGQLVLAMAKDYEKTGKCNSALVQGEFVFVYHLIWGVRWGDPRKELFNRGILRMQESGLIDWWARCETAGSERCVKEEQGHKKSTPVTKLTISKLQGPFAILVAGIVSATFSWIVEVIIFHRRRLLF